MIDTKALRSRILDLAIQGKLTEQLESDGEAFDNNGRIKMHSDENPFHIPDNWKWSTVNAVISKDVGGGTPSKTVKEYWDGGTIPWMSVKDFSSAKNGVLYDTKDHITEAGLQNSTSNLIDTNAIIICVRMGLGRIVKLRRPTAINQDLRAIWLSDCIDRDYFIYFYSTLRVEGHGMTVSGISKKELMSFRLPLPPLAEQKRIVARVEEIFRLLDTIDEAQEQYAMDVESLKAKLITAGIQGKLTEQLDSDGTAEELYQQIQEEKQRLIKEGKIKKEKPLPEIKPEEVPFEIPESWKWVRLNEICKSVMDGDHQPPPQTTEGMPFIVISNLSNGALDFSNTRHVSKKYFDSLSNERIAEQGDILFTVTGSFGIPIKVEADQQFCFQRHIALLKQLDSINTNYLLHVLKSEFVYKQCDDVALGVAQRTVGIKLLRNFLIPLPPLAEQKRIAEMLERVLRALA